MYMKQHLINLAEQRSASFHVCEMVASSVTLQGTLLDNQVTYREVAVYGSCIWYRVNATNFL